MITIICSGSRGDIQPYIALAVELKKLGKDVRITAGASFGEFIRQYGIEHYSLALDYKSAEIDPKLLEAAQNSTNPLKMLLTFNKMKKYARLMVDEMYESCLDSEVIVYHPGCTIGYFAAEHLGIPSVLASPFPMLQTKEIASIIAYGKVKMPISSSYQLLQKMLFMASKPGVASFWQDKFGALPPQFSAPFERIDAQQPSVVACSNAIFPRPHDWQEHVYQSGYWFLPELATDVPTPELQAFLAAGEKPIYFGFGSVFQEKDRQQFVTMIQSALEQTGKRGIICGMGLIPNLPPNILTIESVAHQWLFPQCAAVCHHGGAGTSAAGFAAGVPSIIIPFSNDQFAWAHRAADIGVGAQPIYKKKLTVTKLITAITEVSSPTMREAAQKLGATIAEEHGAADCAKVIANLTIK